MTVEKAQHIKTIFFSALLNDMKKVTYKLTLKCDYIISVVFDSWNQYLIFLIAFKMIIKTKKALL